MPDEKTEAIIDALADHGEAIAKYRREVSDLVNSRDRLMLTGHKHGLSFAQMGRAAGIRRESAHLAVRRLMAKKEAKK